MHFLSSRLALAVILVAAFAPRLANLTFQPLWFDEGWSVWFATSDLPTMAARTAVDIHPPFYYALLHFWIGAAGSGEFALRLLSVFVGVMTVAMVYRFGASLAGRRAGWLAAAVTALSPLQVYYAQEIRMYGLVTLLGLASSWLFWTAVTEGRVAQDRRRVIGRWAAYVVVTGAMLYTQYYAAFIPLFHFVFLVLSTRRRYQFVFPLMSFSVLLILFAPWLLYAGPKLADYVGNKIGIEKYDPVPLGDYLLRHLIAFSAGHLAGGSEWLGWATALFAALAILGLVSLWHARTAVSEVQDEAAHVDGGKGHPETSGAEHAAATSSRSAALFLILYLLVPVAAAYLVQLRFPFAPPRMERLLLLASPPFLVLVAAGIAALRVRSWAAQAGIRRLLPNLLAAIAGGVLVAVSAASLAGYFVVPRYPEQDYRALAARINALALPGDVVVCVHPWQVGFLQAYLDVPVSIQQAADPAWGDADRTMLDGALAAGHRIWLPAYQTLGRILESAMEGYLLQHALAVDAQWYQETRLSFYAPAPNGETPAAFAPFSTGTAAGQDFMLFDPRLSLGRAVQAGESQAGWSAVPLILRWRVSEPVEQLSYSLRLYDQSGRLWAAQERQPMLGSVPMDGWTVNNDYIDRTGFLIPAGVPPGNYSLRFLLYLAADGTQVGPEAVVASVPVLRAAIAPRPAALSIQTPLITDWPGQRLLGYALRERTWLPGEAMHVDLFWQATDGARSAERSFVQVLDEQGKVVAQNAAQTLYPPSAWQRGELVREQRDLTLPANLAPGVYVVAAGLLQADGTTHVVSVRDRDTLNLRKIAVNPRPHQMTPPAARLPADLRFGDLARMVGLDIERRSITVTMRLYWQVLKETDTPYKVFVHLVAPGSVTPAAQHDSPPANGALPTTTWIKGEYITDEHVIDMAGVPLDSYNVLVGLYDPQSGVRVPAFALDQSEYKDDAANLGLFRWK